MTWDYQQLTWDQWRTIEYTKHLTINNSVVRNSLYPSIQINSQVSDVQVIFEIDFTDYFKRLYSSYVNAPRYFFAFKFFVWDVPNWWFFNVTRNTAGWVSNTDILSWAFLWRDIVWWKTRTIPWSNAIIANPTNPWYRSFSIQDFLNNNVWRQVSIWWYLSSTKDMRWWNFTVIRSIRIEYFWPENAIEFVE
jgi:hypothetical protein